MILRPLHVAAPDRLAIVLEVRPTSVNHNVPYLDFVAYRSGQRSFVDLGTGRAARRLTVGSGASGWRSSAPQSASSLRRFLGRAIAARLYGVTAADVPTRLLSAALLCGVARWPVTFRHGVPRTSIR